MPSARLVTPGTRTEETPRAKAKRATTVEPETIIASTSPVPASAFAMVRERRRCPSPNVSWL